MLLWPDMSPSAFLPLHVEGDGTLSPCQAAAESGGTAQKGAAASRRHTKQGQDSAEALSLAVQASFHCGILWQLLFLLVATALCPPSSSSATSGVCGCRSHLFSWLMLSHCLSRSARGPRLPVCSWPPW